MARQPIPVATNASANLNDRIAASKNPEFSQWLKEFWQEAAQREGNKLQYVYKRAMDNMIIYPESILEVRNASKVPYVGPAIVTKLERKLEKFLADGGKLINGDCITVDASQPQRPTTAAAALQESQLGTNISLSQPTTQIRPVTNTGARKARPYIPSYRSGPYAMLIALYLESQKPDTKNCCTRQEIVSLGQPYCSSPMEEGTFSALKGAIKKLEERQLVTKWGMPYRYTLTDEGVEMAERLWNSGERRSSAPIQELQIPRTRTAPETTKLVIPIDVDCSEDEANIDETSVSDVPLMTFRWEPGTFDLKLVIDNREVKSRTERDYLFQSLSASGIPIEQRSLELGDFIWVARKRQEFRLGGHDDLEEAVLDLIIERKTEDDLLHSIVDGRFVEQKFRLNSSGIVNRIYLLEKFEGADFTGIGEAKFRAAIVHTQVIDNVFLRYTSNLEDSIKFVIALHNDLIQKYTTKPIYLAVHPDSESIRRASFLAAIHRQSQQDSCRYLMSFGAYSQINSKSANQSLRDIFLRQLMTVNQMSADRASLISERFPTPISLWEMYAGLPDDKARKEYFKEWAVPGHARKFGPSLSARICETFWSG